MHTVAIILGMCSFASSVLPLRSIAAAQWPLTENLSCLGVRQGRISHQIHQVKQGSHDESVDLSFKLNHWTRCRGDTRGPSGNFSVVVKLAYVLRIESLLRRL